MILSRQPLRIAQLLILLALLCGCSNGTQQRTDSLTRLNLSAKDQADLIQAIRSHSVYLESWSLDARTISCGAAVILTEDGYLLTAAHCLPKSPRQFQFIAFPNDPQTLELIVFHRVWIGDPTRADRDIALLRIDRAGLAPIEWCDDAELKTGVPILAAGSSQVDTENYITVCAGTICDLPAVDSSDSNKPIRLVRIKAPIGRGDSGGPATTTTGKLIGLTRDLTWQLDPGGSLVTLVRPSPQWIARLISEDRKRPPASQPVMRFELKARRVHGPAARMPKQ